MGIASWKGAAALVAVLASVVWAGPGEAADLRLGVGGITRSREDVGPARLWWLAGTAGEVSLDWRLAAGHEAGLRLRLLVYPPGWVEADAGVGYRYTFRTSTRVRPFLGGALTLAHGNECIGNFCGPGFSGWLEGGVDVKFDRLSLAAWVSPYARFFAAPHLYGGGSLWVGVVL